MLLSPGDHPVLNRKAYLILGSLLISVLVFLVVLRGLLTLPQQQQKVKDQVAPNIVEKRIDGVKPTINIPQPSPTAGLSIWNSYSDQSYGISLRYPAGWTVLEEIDREGNPMIRIRLSTAQRAKYNARKLPDISIGLTSPYSTSNAVCGNQVCEETQTIPIQFNNTTVDTKLIKATVVDSIGVANLDYYAFVLDSGLVAYAAGQTVESRLLITSSVRDLEELKTVRDILETLTYKKIEPAKTPNIVEQFLCGDYCPGEAAQYMKKVYEGISDEQECLDLQGIPYTYTGWATVTVCLVNENKTDTTANDMQMVRSALELYRLDENRYPQTLEELTPAYLVKLPENTTLSYLLAEDKLDYTLSAILKDGSSYEEHAP